MNRQNNKRDRDYVVGLLSGRTEQRKNRDGDVVTVFIPKQTNKHQPLDTIYAKTKKSQIEILIAEGVQQPMMNINQQEFVKTSSERELLKTLKRELKESLIKAGFNPKTRMNASKPVFIHWRAFD